MSRSNPVPTDPTPKIVFLPGLWTQDFPLKRTTTATTGTSAGSGTASGGGSAARHSTFEDDLQRYLATLQLPREAAGLLRGVVAAHDFSGARWAGVCVTSEVGICRWASFWRLAGKHEHAVCRLSYAH
jgi:hypothetical protein